MLPLRFQQFFGPFTLLLVEESLKWNFLNIYLTVIFGIRKFQNTSAMRVIFFLKMFKIEFKFWKCKENSKIIFCFWDNCIWKCCNKLHLLTRKYMSLAVNGLANSSKILHIAQRNFINLNSLSHRPINMVKVLSFRFEQCIGLFTMLLLKGSSEMGLFRHLSNHVFRSV